MRAHSASLCRIGAAQLERHRMLGRVEGQEPRAVAVQHRAGRDHLGIDQRAAREQAMEEPAVPVGPFHHRGDAETTVVGDHDQTMHVVEHVIYPKSAELAPAPARRWLHRM